MGVVKSAGIRFIIYIRYKVGQLSLDLLSTETERASKRVMALIFLSLFCCYPGTNGQRR